jgi:hypothetical protein
MAEGSINRRRNLDMDQVIANSVHSSWWKLARERWKG